MRSTCIIVLRPVQKLPEITGEFIGADAGAQFLAEKGIRMHLAIGDFDSVPSERMDKIRQFSKEIIKLNPVKDISDSQAALEEAMREGYSSFWMVGALGGRMDHTSVNLRLMEYCPYPIVLYDDQNTVRILEKGSHRIHSGRYKYVSFFAVNEAVLSLSGMKYPLQHRMLKEKDTIGLSNELIGNEGLAEVHSGRVMMIQSNDR